MKATYDKVKLSLICPKIKTSQREITPFDFANLAFSLTLPSGQTSFYVTGFKDLKYKQRCLHFSSIKQFCVLVCTQHYSVTKPQTFLYTFRLVFTSFGSRLYLMLTNKSCCIVFCSLQQLYCSCMRGTHCIYCPLFLSRYPTITAENTKQQTAMLNMTHKDKCLLQPKLFTIPRECKNCDLWEVQSILFIFISKQYFIFIHISCIPHGSTAQEASLEELLW